VHDPAALAARHHLFLGEAFRPCYLGRQEACDLTYQKDGALAHLFRIHTSPPPSGASAVTVGMYGRATGYRASTTTTPIGR
jgi:hypothetical protein